LVADSKPGPDEFFRLVAYSDRSDAQDLATAAGCLAQTGCPIAGIVLNRCRSPLPRSHAFSGYGPANA
jgi:Mrp family chromosome partitioning ATPase